MMKTGLLNKIVFTAAGFTVLASASVLNWRAQNPSQPRQPASIDAKERTLSGENSWRLPISGKSHGLVEIAITAPHKGAVGKGTIIELEANIEARSDLDQLKFVWLLPREGVTVVRGPIDGDIGALKEAEQTKLTLAIRNDTDENRQIHLHVYKIVNGENMGKMAQYNTVNQEALDWVAKDKAEKLRQKAEARGSTVNKIYQ